MDHTEAVKGKFTERYLLSELTPAQRDQFEEHYFDCAICGEDVQTGATFIANARAVLQDKPSVEVQGLFTRFGLPFQTAAWAFMLLLGVFSYENIVTIPKLKGLTADSRVPRIVSVVSLLDMGSRAAASPRIAPVAKDFQSPFEIPGGPEFSGYVCEIRDAENQLRYSLPITVEQAKDTLALSVPASAFGAGNYQVIVLGEKPGAPPQKLVEYPVTIR